MDEIQELVREVIRQCASRGVTVSEVLAAFVARTVIEKSTVDGQPLFSLDKPLTQEAVNDLIDRSVDRLLETDSPSLETLKMQVAFDSSYITEEEDLESYYMRRNTRLREMQRTIVMMKARDGADFDALTALHRQIFAYLLRHTHDGSDIVRGVEREVAAALESVFPRISLKAFIALPAEERFAQLDELANIVLGIRVFNHHIGKGGVNIPDPEKDVVTLLQQLGASLAKEVEDAQGTCLELQDLIVHIHLRQPQGVTDTMLTRWKDELANRRQYLSYLQSLQEDTAVSERKVGTLRQTMGSEMADLQELVGNRTSVPKEHVYPKFFEIATEWTALYREYKIILGRARTMEVLQSFSNSYTPSLTSDLDVLQSVAHGSTASLEEDAQAAEAAVAVTTGELKEEGGTGGAEAKGIEDREGRTDDSKREGTPDTTDQVNAHEIQEGGGERPVKLSIESTPEFMQLPLEYQGFCPWTIVNRQGLLLPGKPELGVVRYKNAYFVFAHRVAITTFLDHPDRFIAGVHERAMLSPELIHLLRLQDAFPKTSITRMLKGGKGQVRSSLTMAPPEKKDAGTETPVHLVEGHIDPGYHWNEWVLRRRALNMANLRMCATKSQQTDDSHFRRAADTQVHLPRVNDTQTTRSSGTNPPQHIQYFAGEK
ncbi:unnamed protein product, partial [Discosporangium mesarthrocarpum]